MLYCNMSIYCNTLGAIYQCGKIQYRPSSNMELFHLHMTAQCCVCVLKFSTYQASVITTITMHIAAVTSLVDFNLLYTLLLYTAVTAITSLTKQPYFY